MRLVGFALLATPALALPASRSSSRRTAPRHGSGHSLPPPLELERGVTTREHCKATCDAASSACKGFTIGTCASGAGTCCTFVSSTRHVPHAARIHAPPATFFSFASLERDDDIPDASTADEPLEQSPDDNVMALWCQDAAAFVAVAETDMVPPAYADAGIESKRAAADAALATAAEAAARANGAWQANPDGGPLEPAKLDGKTYHFRIGSNGAECVKVTIGGSAYTYQYSSSHGCDDEAESRMEDRGTTHLGNYDAGESTDMQMHFTGGSNSAGPCGCQYTASYDEEDCSHYETLWNQYTEECSMGGPETSPEPYNDPYNNRYNYPYNDYGNTMDACNNMMDAEMDYRATSTEAKLEPSMLRERFMLVAVESHSAEGESGSVAFYSMAHARFLVVSDDGESLVESPTSLKDAATVPPGAAWAPRATFSVIPAPAQGSEAETELQRQLSYLYNADSNKFVRVDPATGTVGLTARVGGDDDSPATPAVAEGAKFETIYSSAQDSPDEYQTSEGADEIQQAGELLERRAAAESEGEPLEGCTYGTGDMVVLFGVEAEAFLSRQEQTTTTDEPGWRDSGIVRSDAGIVGAGFIFVSKDESSDDAMGLCSLQTGSYLTVPSPCDAAAGEGCALEMVEPDGDGEYTACEPEGFPASAAFKVLNTFRRAEVAIWHVATRRFIDMRAGASGSAVMSSVVFREPKLERGPLHYKYHFKLIDLDAELKAKPLKPSEGSKCLEYIPFDDGEGQPAMEECNAMNAQRWQHIEATEQLVVRHDESCLVASPTTLGNQGYVTMGRCASPGTDGSVENSQRWLWEPTGADGAAPIRSLLNEDYCLEAIPGDEDLMKPTTHEEWKQVRPTASGAYGKTFWTWQPLDPSIRSLSDVGLKLTTCNSEDEPFCKCVSQGNCYTGYCFMFEIGTGVWMVPHDMSRCIQGKPNLKVMSAAVSAGTTTAVEQDGGYTQWYFGGGSEGCPDGRPRQTSLRIYLGPSDFTGPLTTAFEMAVRSNITHDAFPGCVYDAYILAPAHELGISTVIQKPCDSSKASQQWSISNPDAELVRLGAEHPLPDNFVQNACAQAPEGEECEPAVSSLERERKTRKAANGPLSAAMLKLHPPASLRELSLSDAALRRRRIASARQMASTHRGRHLAGTRALQLDFRPNDFGRAASQRRQQTAAMRGGLAQAVNAMKEQATHSKAGGEAAPKAAPSQKPGATKAKADEKKPASASKEVLSATLERILAGRQRAATTAAKASARRTGSPVAGHKTRTATDKAGAGEAMSERPSTSARPAKSAWRPPIVAVPGRKIGALSETVLQPQLERTPPHVPPQPAHATRVPPSSHSHTRKKSAQAYYKQRRLKRATTAGAFLQMDDDLSHSDVEVKDLQAPFTELQRLRLRHARQGIGASGRSSRPSLASASTSTSLERERERERGVQKHRLGPPPAHLQGLEKRRSDLEEVDTRLASGKIIYYVKNEYCYKLRIGYRILRKFKPGICGSPTFADANDEAIESLGVTADFAEDVVTENAAGVGTHGGSCTCPSGAVYQVGEVSGSDCTTLACAGGVAGVCSKAGGVWSRRSVTCGGAGAALVRTTIKGCACKQTWTYEGVTVNDFCGDPNGLGYEWCYVKDGCTAETAGLPTGPSNADWGYCAPNPADIMADEVHMRAEERRLATLTKLDLAAYEGKYLYVYQEDHHQEGGARFTTEGCACKHTWTWSHDYPPVMRYCAANDGTHRPYINQQEGVPSSAFELCELEDYSCKVDSPEPNLRYFGYCGPEGRGTGNCYELIVGRGIFRKPNAPHECKGSGFAYTCTDESCNYKVMGIYDEEWSQDATHVYSGGTTNGTPTVMGDECDGATATPTVRVTAYADPEATELYGTVRVDKTSCTFVVSLHKPANFTGPANIKTANIEPPPSGAYQDGTVCKYDYHAHLNNVIDFATGRALYAYDPATSYCYKTLLGRSLTRYRVSSADDCPGVLSTTLAELSTQVFYARSGSYCYRVAVGDSVKQWKETSSAPCNNEYWEETHGPNGSGSSNEEVYNLGLFAPDPTQPDKQFYREGGSCGSNPDRSTTVTIQNDPDITEVAFDVSESTPCAYTIQMSYPGPRGPVVTQEWEGFYFRHPAKPYNEPDATANTAQLFSDATGCEVVVSLEYRDEINEPSIEVVASDILPLEVVASDIRPHPFLPLERLFSKHSDHHDHRRRGEHKASAVKTSLVETLSDLESDLEPMLSLERGCSVAALKVLWPFSSPVAAAEHAFAPLVVGEGKHEQVRYSSSLAMYLDESATPGAVSITLTEGDCALSFSISGQMDDLKAGPMMSAFDCAMDQSNIEIYSQESDYGGEIEGELEDSLRAQIAAATACCGHAADMLTGEDETDDYGDDSMAEEQTTLVAGAGGGVQYCLRSASRVIQARSAHADGLLAHFDPENLLAEGGNMFTSQCNAERLVLGDACNKSVELIDKTRKNLRDLIDSPIADWHAFISGPFITEYLPAIYEQLEGISELKRTLTTLDTVLLPLTFLPGVGSLFSTAKRAVRAFKSVLSPAEKVFKKFKLAISMVLESALTDTDNVDKLAKVAFYAKRFLRELQAVVHIVNYVYSTNPGKQEAVCGAEVHARYEVMVATAQKIVDDGKKVVEDAAALLGRLADIGNFFTLPMWVGFWEFLDFFKIVLDPFSWLLNRPICFPLPWMKMEYKCFNYWWLECSPWHSCRWKKYQTCLRVPVFYIKQFCFTVQQILNGLNNLVQVVVDGLNWLVQQALDFLGIPEIPWPDLGLDALLELLKININWPAFPFHMPTFNHPLLGLLDCTMQKVPQEDEDLERFGQMLLTGGGALAGGGALERARNTGRTNAQRWATTAKRAAAANSGQSMTEDSTEEELIKDADKADTKCFDFQACKEAFVEVAAFYGSKEDSNAISRGLDFAQCVAVDIAGFQQCEEQEEANVQDEAAAADEKLAPYSASISEARTNDCTPAKYSEDQCAD